MTTEQFMSAQLTQLAALTKTHKDTWTQYLYKNRNPGSVFLKKAAKQLEMSVDDLLIAMESRKAKIRQERRIRAEINELINASQAVPL